MLLTMICIIYVQADVVDSPITSTDFNFSYILSQQIFEHLL
jgi:hypothetical protein